MKMHRVFITATVVAGLIAAFFFVPLPVGRVHETGLVQVHESNISRVYLTDIGYLKTLRVQDGMWVNEGDLIAEFSNPKLESDLAQATAEQAISGGRMHAIQSVMTELRNDANNRGMMDLSAELIDSQSKYDLYSNKVELLKQQLARLKIKAPRSGYVMSPPKRDEVGRLWDKGPTEPLCSIGDPKKIRVLVPINPVDYRLLTQDLKTSGNLEASILIPGRMDHIFTGNLKLLPQQDAKNVPLQLTHRGGGSLAVKPNNDPNQMQPLNQVYLAHVEIVDPDWTVTPGTLAKIKVHTEWRSAAWWTWRGLASALDLGLI